MALISPQPISNVITPSYAAPTTSDTVRADTGLLLYVKNGATSSTVNVNPSGNQVYSGVAKDPLTATFSNGERVFFIPPEIADPTTNLVSVTFSSVATVTVALFKI